MAYLNNIKSISADFIQTTDGGEFAEGKFYLSRPGKFRWDYLKQPILIIANGSHLAYIDRELDQVSYVPINDSIASIITRRNIRFSGDIEVTNFVKNEETMKISFIKSKDKNKDEGEFSFIFQNDPMKLLRIEVLDNSNTLITISLFNIVFDSKIDSKLFVVKDPRLR